MDVKDVPVAKELANQSNKNPAQALQKSLKALTTSPAEMARREAVKLEVASRRVSSGSEARAKTNEAINVVNVASEATSDIEKLINSISGIVEQASNPNMSESRRKVLEQEANQLVAEIRRKALSKTSDGVRPLAGDKYSLKADDKSEVEFDIALPDAAKDAFGLGDISLSSDASIPVAKSALSRAREQVEKLRDSVKQTQAQVKNTVDALEVALQNSEAAQTSVRDVDEALKLAGRTKADISRNPDSALESVGNLQRKALNLLE
jgi:flagellin-like hook-associated protein FlgL